MRAVQWGVAAWLVAAVGAPLSAQPRPAEPAGEKPVLARGRWMVSEPSTVTVNPDGTARLVVPMADPMATYWATLMLAEKPAASGVRVRVKCEGHALVHIGVYDADDTAAYVPVWTTDPDADGWRDIGFDFAALDNRGEGNFVMEALQRLTVSVFAGPGGDKTVTLVVQPPELLAGGPTRMANAPPGDAALQPLSAQRITGTEEGDGATWQPWDGATVALDRETVHEGETSVRLGVRVTTLEGEGSGGNVSVVPPEGAQWLGDRLVFWCFPRDAAFLPVIINDRNGTQISEVLKPPGLVVGQWNRVEIPFADAIYAGTGDKQLDEVGSVVFIPHTGWDHEGAFLTRPGEYVWFIDGLHVEGQGPVAVGASVPLAQPPAIPGGLIWMPVKGATVAWDEAVAHEGEPAARLTVTIGQGEGEGSGGHIVAAPPQGETWLGDRLVFWCLPKDVPFLPVIVNDKDGTQVATVLAERELKVGEWNRVEIPFAAARQGWGAEDLQFGEVGSVLLLPYTAWDTDHTHLKVPGEYTWYIADLHVEGQGPVDLGGEQMDPVEALGLDAAWSVKGDCLLEPEAGAAPDGGDAARLSIALTPDPQSGGTVFARPPDGRPWPATGLRFRCRAETAPYLVVQATDGDGSTVIWYLSRDDLPLHQWTDVELQAGSMMNLEQGDNTLDNIASLRFECYGYDDPQRGMLPKQGEVAWHLADLALLGPGPAILAPRPAPAGSPQALRDDTGDDLDWSWAGRAYAEAASDVVHDGARSIRLTLPPRRAGQPRYGNVVADLRDPRPARAVRFWLRPAQFGPLTVFATDGDSHTARWTIGEERLAPEEWTRVELPVAEATVSDNRNMAPASPADLRAIRRISFATGFLAPAAEDEWRCYVDSLQLIGEGEP